MDIHPLGKLMAKICAVSFSVPNIFKARFSIYWHQLTQTDDIGAYFFLLEVHYIPLNIYYLKTECMVKWPTHSYKDWQKLLLYCIRRICSRGMTENIFRVKNKFLANPLIASIHFWGKRNVLWNYKMYKYIISVVDCFKILGALLNKMFYQNYCSCAMLNVNRLLHISDKWKRYSTQRNVSVMTNTKCIRNGM